MNQQVNWIFDRRPIDTPYLLLVEDTAKVAGKQENFWDQNSHWLIWLAMLILSGFLN
jgi:hypothetical protein